MLQLKKVHFSICIYMCCSKKYIKVVLNDDEWEQILREYHIHKIARTVSGLTVFTSFVWWRIGLI